MNYLIHLSILICIYLIIALSLQLSVGFAGLLNLGHIAFYLIGAYASALLSMQGAPFSVCLPAAGIFAMIAGMLVGILTNKIKGDYFALATMGFSFVVYAVALNWISFTRGPLGIPGIPKPVLFGVNFYKNSNFLILVFCGALFSYLTIKKITSSPFGKVLEAIRDNELAVKVLGKNSFRMKCRALMISAFFAGIAGSFYAHYITYIDPSSFSLMQLIPILCIVIIGGLASLEGTIAATIILVLLPEPLRFIGFPSSVIGPARQIIYACLLLLILIYKPQGIKGKIEI